MDKPHRLKSDIELTVDDEQNSGPSPEEVGANPNTHVPDPASANADAPGDAVISDPASTKSPIPKPSQSNDLPSRMAAKRMAEQAFLKNYKARQIRIRAAFVLFAVIVFLALSAGLSQLFKKNESGRSALSGMTPVLMAACLGERDLAYYEVSNFEVLKTNNTDAAHLVNQRTKILDRSISELEKTGRLAIFSRLGTEAMLMEHGDRALGLKYGDYLIDKYPELASNYCWRANVDVNNADFAHGIQEYEQFAKILERSPETVGRSWATQLNKAVWCCIDAGQSAEAFRFADLYEKLYFNKEDIKGLKSQILLSSCEALAIPQLRKTDFWNQDLANRIQHRLARAKAIARSISMYGFESDFDSDTDIDTSGLLFDISLLEDHSYARHRITEYPSSSNYKDTLEAKLALSDNHPVAAFAACSKGNSDYPTLELAVLEASALQKLPRPQQAIEAVDTVFKYYHHLDGYTMRHYLPLLQIKAQALFDSGSYEKALAQCERILSANSHLIEPRLLKIRCLQKLNRSAEEASERKNIVDELQSFAKSEETGL